MYKTHLSYINSNIYQLYKDYTFSEQYDVENVDNSAYYGQTVFKFVRDHLGYRFVLRNSELSETVPQGDTLKLNFTVENTGFASLLKAPETETISELLLISTLCNGIPAPPTQKAFPLKFLPDLKRVNGMLI